MFTLHHIGIVVASLDESVPLYCKLLGVEPSAVVYHDVPTEKVRVAMFHGNAVIELLQPTDPGSGLAKYLEKRGPGFHHLCFAAPQPLETKLGELRDKGFSLLDETPRVGADGRVIFVHPKSAGGLLVEFVEES
jgi:methylmalonyl-CoA epimerase